VVTGVTGPIVLGLVARAMLVAVVMAMLVAVVVVVAMLMVMVVVRRVLLLGLPGSVGIRRIRLRVVRVRGPVLVLGLVSVH
jgi:hypothetical protein